MVNKDPETALEVLGSSGSGFSHPCTPSHCPFPPKASDPPPACSLGPMCLCSCAISVSLGQTALKPLLTESLEAESPSKC